MDAVAIGVAAGVAAGLAGKASTDAKAYADEKIAQAIAALPKGIVYRGAVDYTSELPASPALGDCYTVKYRGSSGTDPLGVEYAWGQYEGALQWIPLSDENVYHKPSTGIPKSDLAQSVQESLNDADSAYQKPSTGIPSTDMTEAVQSSLSKAESALQEHQSLAAYRTSAAQDIIDGGKQDTIISAGAAAGQFVRVKTVDASGKPTEYESAAITRTITVTCVTQDGVVVTGQTVTVREGSATGKVYATAAYDGQPVSFSVLPGFVYYISVSNTLPGHFGPTTATGIVQSADIAVTLTYSDYTNIHTFMDIQAALDDGIDLSGLIGESVTADWGNLELEWDVADYDSTNKEVTLLLHDTLPDQMAFEPEQVLSWFEDGLAAGNYSFIHSGTTYYFTLSAAIPAGGQLKATTTTFSVFASQVAETAQESGTVSTEVIEGATSLGTTATGNLNHMDRITYGSNNAKESALFAWLNSNQGPNEILASRPCKFSRYYKTGSRGGFLYNFDADSLACVADTQWNCRANNVYEAPASMGGTTVKGTTYALTSKFFLASTTELGLDGSEPWDLFVGATNPDRIKYYNGTARAWWTRFSRVSTANTQYYVSTSGALNLYSARNTSGVAPACKIKQSN